MSARPTHDLAIKTGEYTDRNTGEVKKRWLRIGTVLKHDDGGTSIKLDALPIGLPGWEGWVSVFKRSEQPATSQPPRNQGRPNGGNGHGGSFDDFDDDIPF